MTRQNLAKQAAPLLEYLEGWMSALPVITMRQAAPQASRAAILSVDITNGFCYEGNLSSPRVAGLVEPITRLFTQALEYGIRSIALSQDTHEPDAVEFAQFPPHCVRGSSEAQTVDAIKALPFSAQMAILEKNSVEPGFNTG